MKRTRTPVSVVMQTHWDREWYYPRETYAARLVRVMARVVPMLQSGALKHFLLDGQTAALEDLRAEAEPALTAQVETLIRDGRILLGPWYISADEFLVSGESLLRNLEQGTQDVASATSAAQTFMGYLPDTFGHIAQMPLILAQFGIGTAVLWRGADAAHSEFDWAALDGTTLPTLYLTEGYYQHPLNVPEFAPALLKYLDTIAPRSLANHLLLTQGGDHLSPRADLDERMAAFNAADNNYTLHETTLPRYAEMAVNATHGQRALIEGELRHNRAAFVLPDVLSTRRYLKHAQQALEDRLIGEIEPLAAMLLPPALTPWKYLRDTWRQLIQNQAHDSICGCSVDSVHREMEVRFEKLQQRCDALLRIISVASGFVSELQHEGGPAFLADDTHFTLFNPLPHTAAGPHRVSVFLQGEACAPELTDRGLKVACSVISTASTSEFHSPLDDFPDVVQGYRYDLAIALPLEGYTARALTVTRGQLAELPAQSGDTTKVIHNRRYLVSYANGLLTLQDSATQALHPGFLGLVSELDAGDAYNFSPPAEQTTSRTWSWELLACDQTEHSGRMTLAIRHAMPAGLRPDRTGASRAQAISTGTLEVLLLEGDGPLRCKLSYANAAADQRTRLAIKWPDAEAVGETTSDTAFAFTPRQHVWADYPKTILRREMPVAVQPSQSTILARPFFVNHRAMHEYEVVKDRDSTYLGITLVRSVGWMSRRDLVTRGVGAGPDMPTPQAQCLRTDTFDFMLGCIEPADAATVALAHARALRRAPIKLRGVSDHWRTGFTLADPQLEVSAFRPFESDGIHGRELRLWNPTALPRQTGLSATEWTTVRADGAPTLGRVDAVAPFSLLTLRQVSP